MVWHGQSALPPNSPDNTKHSIGVQTLRIVLGISTASVSFAEPALPTQADNNQRLP